MRYLLLTLPLLSSACGYQVVSGRAPLGADSILVRSFAELEPIGIAPELQQELSVLLAHGGTTLARDERAASAVLDGRITAAHTSALPIVGPASPVPAYQVTLELEASLIARDGTTLWSVQLSSNEDFLPARNEDSTTVTLGTEAQRRRALERLAKRLALAIYDRLVLAPPRGGV